MQGYDDGRKRLRVGSWRIVYRIDSQNKVEILWIIDIGNRGDIYKQGGILMTAIAANVAKMIDMLPEEDQKFAQEFVKSLCLLGIPILPS